MRKDKTLTDEQREASGGTLAVIAVSVLIIWATSGWLVSSTKDPGQFGDMFGAVNALFSGLAFATLIYTVFLQRRELQLQREELAETRKELRRSAAAQEASEAALRAQAETAELTATLSTTHTLLTYYRDARTELMQRSVQLEPDIPRKIAFLEKKEQPLYALLEDSYQKITRAHATQRHMTSATPPPEN